MRNHLLKACQLRTLLLRHQILDLFAPGHGWSGNEVFHHGRRIEMQVRKHALASMIQSLSREFLHLEIAALQQMTGGPRKPMPKSIHNAGKLNHMSQKMAVIAH